MLKHVIKTVFGNRRGFRMIDDSTTQCLLSPIFPSPWWLGLTSGRQFGGALAEGGRATLRIDRLPGFR